MYSIVMLTAMSAGADVTPPPAPVAAAPVATGCCGSVVIGCYGSCYGSSCYGSSCYGSSCYGSSCHGHAMRSGFLGHRSSCHGCSGYSCSGYNCFGSCYGSYITSFGSCQGCSGMFSYGSTWGPPIGMPPYTLHGYNTGLAGYGPGVPVVVSGYSDPNAVWGATANPNRPPVMTIPVAPMVKPSSDGNPMGANLKFTVPAETKLFVDGKLVPGTGTERTFYTPPLAEGQKFFYDVKAELVVDKKTVTEEKRVIVEAGANVTETFPKLIAAAAVPTTVAGK
ncbi:MAG TPA: TIGR03000 domain-containing protein [Gemmata sp.]